MMKRLEIKTKEFKRPLKPHELVDRQDADNLARTLYSLKCEIERSMPRTYELSPKWKTINKSLNDYWNKHGHEA